MLSKIDLVTPEEAAAKLKQLQKAAGKAAQVFALSSQRHENLDPVLYALVELVKAYRAQEAAVESAADETETGVPVLRLDSEKPWIVTKTAPGAYEITGHRPEKFAARTDFSNEESVQRYRSILQKMGVMHELSRQKITPGTRCRLAAAGLHSSFTLFLG